MGWGGGGEGRGFITATVIRYSIKLHQSRTRSGLLYYAIGPCATSLITGQYEMIVIDLAEPLSEWWFALSTNPNRANQSNTRRLGYTVRGGIEAGGQMKCPRTAGLGYMNNILAVLVAPFFSSCIYLEEFLNRGLDPVLWCGRCIPTLAS